LEGEKGMLKKFLSGYLTFAGIVFWIAGGALHLYTVFLYYKLFGFFWAGMSFIFPFLAQIILTIHSVSVSGALFNTYSMLIFAYALGYLFFILLISKLDKALEG
jgi:hypothetical protein